MHDLKWSDSEKKVAKRAFEGAHARELSALLEILKNRAAEANTPEDIWALHDFLSEKRKDIGQKYDYRYSQMIFVLGRLLRDKWITEHDLQGLREEKLTAILQLATGLPE